MANVNSYTSNLGLDIMPITQDPKVLPDMIRVYNAIKLLASNLDIYSGAQGESSEYWGQAGITRLLITNLCRLYVPASETIKAGMIVNLYNSSGNLTARKAVDSPSNKSDPYYPQNAFALSNSVGGQVEVALMGVNTAYSGLVPGTTYYTSTTPGNITAAGNITYHLNVVGTALNSTSLWIPPHF